MHLCLKRGEGDAHVGRVRRDAGLARAEDRVHAVETVACGAAGTRSALVAGGKRGIGEVTAAGALQQVAANARHIAKLRRRAGEKRLRQQGIALAHQPVVGKVAVAHQGPDPHAAVGQLSDPV